MIDWTRLDELRGEVGAEAFDEVLSLFLSETDAMAAQLDSGANPETLEGDLHFLKGAALNIGFAELAEACQDGEARARGGAPGSVDVPAIIACYRRARAALLAAPSVPDGLARRLTG